ncbi:hypothetical protein GCM10010524_62390 [Streptomyces mexicanus]|jgi:hypothetical protein
MISCGCAEELPSGSPEVRSFSITAEKSPDQQEGAYGDQGEPDEGQGHPDSDQKGPDKDQKRPDQDQECPDDEEKDREDGHGCLLSSLPL